LQNPLLEKGAKMDIADSLNQARVAVESNKPQQATGILRKVIQQDPRNVDAWLLLADILENPDHARQSLERVLKLDPGNAIAREKLDLLNDPFADLFAFTQDGEMDGSQVPPESTVSYETLKFETSEHEAAMPEEPLYGEEPVMPQRSQPVAPLIAQSEGIPKPQPAVVRPQNRKPKQPQKKSSHWLEISLGVIVVMILCVILFAIIGQSDLLKTSPTPTPQDPRGVIVTNMNTANAEDLDGYMETIHSKASGRLLTRTAMQGLFNEYDLRYDVYGLQILEQTEDEARVAFTLVTRKIRGPEFANNKIVGVMILRLDDGAWKIFNQEVTSVTYLD
jgi:hypothetical protein